jgi:AraC-like DNA-binding protein
MATLIETTDADAAYEALSGLYGIRRFTAPGDRSFLRIGQDQFGPVSLDSLTFNMECDMDGAPLDSLFIGYVAGGSISYRYGRDDKYSHTYGAGDVLLAVQPGVPFHVDVSDADLHLVVLGVPLLSQVADAARPVQFTGYRPATAEDARRWLTAQSFVRDHLLGTPVAAGPLVAAGAARLLAATALSIFPNNVLTEPTIQDRNDAHPATVRRATRFIDDNAHRDISAADIAAAANVTIRALQLGFGRHLNCTPTGYLRRVRLENAHRELLAADPTRQTVTAVARRWGFPSHSRFTAYYRQAYGHLPSETLQSWSDR